MAVRPRLLAISLGIAVVVSVPAGWLMYRLTAATPVDGSAVLEEPGIYDLPAEDMPGRIGEPLPDIDLVDVDGTPFSTAALRGTPTVVNVWFAACPPCERELAEFATVSAELGDTVRFIGVNPFDDPATMVAFAAARGVDYDLYSDPQSEFIDAMELTAFPRTYFIDADGMVVGETGVLDAVELRFAIRELLR